MNCGHVQQASNLCFYKVFHQLAYTFKIFGDFDMRWRRGAFRAILFKMKLLYDVLGTFTLKNKDAFI